VVAMLVNDADSTLDTVPTEPTTDMSTVTGTDIAGNPLVLRDYITGLSADGPTTPDAENEDPPIYTKLGCRYGFTTDGHVTQTTP